MIQQRVETNVNQVVKFWDENGKSKIREVEVRFSNGNFSSLSFYSSSDEQHRYYSLEQLKELIELFKKVVEFAESNKKEVEQTSKVGANRLLRPEDFK